MSDNSSNLPVPVPKPGGEVIIKRARPAVITDFQSDAVELEERAPPRIARLTLYGVTAFITIAIFWASFSQIDEVVIAPGKLITTRPTIVVQPLETSIIRSIDVAAGEIVKAGQTLATLDATFSQSDVDQQRKKFAALDAQVRRIEAELANADYTKLAGNSSDELLQVQLFTQRRAFVVAQLQNFQQQIAGQTAAIASGEQQQLVLTDRRDNLIQIEKARETLFRNETGSLVAFLGSRDARLDVDSDLTVLRGKGTEAAHALAKLNAERQAFIEDFRRSSMEQLVELRSQRGMADEEVKKMELRRNMITLTAPSDAVVLDLAHRSVGSVVREAEPIVLLVPLDAPLEAEVAVNTQDIGRIAPGMNARIKLDAYPFQKFGTASGNIRVISQDAFTPTEEDKAEGRLTPFFKTRVLLSNTTLHTTGEPVRLLPGMTVSAELKVGRRTVASYFLYPLLRGLDTAIREP